MTAATNLNGPRRQCFEDCPADFFGALGARVTIGGEEIRLGMRRVQLIQPFCREARDERGNLQRTAAHLLPEQKGDLELFGFRFTPTGKAENHYHSTVPFTIGKFYRQVYC